MNKAISQQNDEKLNFLRVLLTVEVYDKSSVLQLGTMEIQLSPSDGQLIQEQVTNKCVCSIIEYA